jgi:hypothetical protein
VATTTVRIGDQARKVLRQICAKTGRRATEVLRDALEEYRRKCFLEDANRAYARLRRDRKAWKSELDERRDWESTLSDGAEKR